MKPPKLIYNKTYRPIDEKIALLDERQTPFELQKLYEVLKWGELHSFVTYEEYIKEQIEEVEWVLKNENIFNPHPFSKIKHDDYDEMILWFELNGYRT